MTLALRTANSAAAWDAIWRKEGAASWRRLMAPAHYWVLAKLHDVVGPPLTPHRPRLLELGAGLGHFAKAAQRAVWDVSAIDISPVAVEHLREMGVDAQCRDLESLYFYGHAAAHDYQAVVALETLEHLTKSAREGIYGACRQLGIPLLLSVPDDRLGPDEEPQHSVQYSAYSLSVELRPYFDRVTHDRIGQVGSLVAAAWNEESDQ